MPSASFDTFDEVRDRLDEIVEAVNAPDITLDAALALYEEAVKLGLAACDLSEEGAEELMAEESGADTAADASGDRPAGQQAGQSADADASGECGADAAEDAGSSAANAGAERSSDVE